MIFAKFSPAASIVRQDGPFSTSTTSVDWMTATTRDYRLGATQVSFEVVYGTVELVDGKVVSFDRQTQNEVTLNADDLADWGTDDSVILDKIAAKQNLTIVDTAEGNLGGGRFFRF